MSILERLKEYVSCGYLHRIRLGSRESLPKDLLAKELIFVLAEGSLELCTREGSKTRTLDILLPGDVFGFRSKQGCLKDYTVRSLTHSTVLYTDMSGLRELGQKNPALLLEFISRTLAKQVYLYEVYTRLHLQKASERIKNLLLLINKAVEEREMDLTVNKRQISGIAGLSYEHTVRTIGRVRLQNARRVRLW